MSMKEEKGNSGASGTSDRELVAASRAGDRAAFDRLVDRYAGRMYQTAYGLLGNREDAEEVVQDGFIRAYRALSGFRGDAGFETWLHRIVVNLARNRFHWNRRRGAEVTFSLSGMPEGLEEERDQEDLAIPDERFNPETLANRAETEAAVLAGFEELPDTLRETLVLRHVDERSYEDIAAVLNCKIGTVKSRLARGREILKGLIEDRQAK